MSAAKEEAALLTPACANIRIVNIEFYEWRYLKEKNNVPAVISFEEIWITNPNCTANNRQPSLDLLSAVSFRCFAVITLSLTSLDIVFVDKNSTGSCAQHKLK